MTDLNKKDKNMQGFPRKNAQRIRPSEDEENMTLAQRIRALATTRQISETKILQLAEAAERLEKTLDELIMAERHQRQARLEAEEEARAYFQENQELIEELEQAQDRVEGMGVAAREREQYIQDLEKNLKIVDAKVE